MQCTPIPEPAISLRRAMCGLQGPLASLDAAEAMRFDTQPAAALSNLRRAGRQGEHLGVSGSWDSWSVCACDWAAEQLTCVAVVWEMMLLCEQLTADRRSCNQCSE